MSTKSVTDIPAQAVEAAQRIWFAGLGAMALAQDEGGRLAGDAARFFGLLVEKGQEMEQAGASPLGQAKHAAGVAEETLGKVQAVVDAQVLSALQRLGIPTRDELAALSRRIETLTASIEELKHRV